MGAAVTINETVSAPPVPYFFDEFATLAAAEGDFETPIQAGTSAVTISLSVQFALEG